MKIMYLGFEGFDNPNGTNHLIIKMFDYLLDEGFEVYYVNSHSKGLEADIPDILVNRRNFTFDIIQRKVIGKKNFVHRYMDGIKYAHACKKSWIKHKNDIDLVILQSTPTAFASSKLLKKHLKCPIIFSSFDVFPNVAFDTGVLKNKLIYKILLKIQKKVYKNSDKIIVISEDMRNTLIKQGVADNKIVEIRNWYDDSKVRIVDYKENKFLQKYGIKKEYFFVQYAGNFGVTFDYKYILDVAASLKHNQLIRFQMIGDGAYKDDFVNEAQKRGLDNIDFYPWQPLDIISDVYSACDVAIIPLAKGVIKNSFPSKGSLLMACKKVILCATEQDSFYYKMINDNNVGICVSNQKPQEAVDALERIVAQKNLLDIIGNKAYEFGVANYSSSSNLPKLKYLLDTYVSKE